MGPVAGEHGQADDQRAKIIAAEQNAIVVYAGDTRVFSGSITSARINLNQMPDAPIEITAAAAGGERLIPVSLHPFAAMRMWLT